MKDRGWRRTRLKFESSITLGKMLQNAPTDATDSLLPYARAASIGQDGTLLVADAKQMWFKTVEQEELALRAGDVLVVEGGDAGRSVLLHEDLPKWGFQNSVNRVRASRGNDPRFIHYWLESARASGYLRSQCDVVSIPHLTAEKIKRLELLIPDAMNQRTIADYLDRETAQIDTLIAKQEQLIATLRERKISKITQSIQGAGLAASLNQSEWYPLLPDGWQAGRLKSFTKRITDGAHISPETEGGDMPFVSTRDVKAGRVDIQGSLRTSRSSFDYMVRTGCQPFHGDVLFSKDGTVGEVAVINDDQEFVVASSLIIATPSQHRVTPEYLGLVLRARTSYEQAVAMMRGAGLPRLSVSNFAKLEMILPPVELQFAIVHDLEDQLAKIDTLIAKAERFIELSKERRAALITAAVTGQLEIPA